MRRFHRPHAAAQPVHEGQIVGEPAKQRLAKMDVRLNEPRQDVSAARVDDAVVRLVDVRADRRDAAVPDRHVAFDDVEAIVHGEDGAAADEEGRHPTSS